MAKDIHGIKECPDCASPELVYNESRQQVVCKECGLIYEELMPMEEERYTASDSVNSQRKSSKQKKR